MQDGNNSRTVFSGAFHYSNGDCRTVQSPSSSRRAELFLPTLLVLLDDKQTKAGPGPAAPLGLDQHLFSKHLYLHLTRQIGWKGLVKWKNPHNVMTTMT